MIPRQIRIQGDHWYDKQYERIAWGDVKDQVEKAIPGQMRIIRKLPQPAPEPSEELTPELSEERQRGDRR